MRRIKLGWEVLVKTGVTGWLSKMTAGNSIGSP
jgi:hypothetical protein